VQRRFRPATYPLAWAARSDWSDGGAVGKTAVFTVHYRRSETPVQATPYPMKVAQHPNSRQPFAVSPDMSERAICPHCDDWL
jgi:hypothetical protein